MERSVHAAEFENELSHWWFVGRREMIARQLDEGLDFASARILDVGTSTGPNLRLLKTLGFKNIVGVEVSPEAARFAQSKTAVSVIVADCTKMPFEDNEFDCVLATDVIEHIDDDSRALCEIMRVLRPGGQLILTVPAFMALWGLQDDLSHHKRRYRKRQLEDLVMNTDFVVANSWYFNFLLFPVIFIARRLIALLNLQFRSEGDLNSPTLNVILGTIFRVDCLLAKKLRPPFGVSICLIAYKRNWNGLIQENDGQTN